VNDLEALTVGKETLFESNRTKSVPGCERPPTHDPETGTRFSSIRIFRDWMGKTAGGLEGERQSRPFPESEKTLKPGLGSGKPGLRPIAAPVVEYWTWRLVKKT
jgi:hypothetical protein